MKIKTANMSCMLNPFANSDLKRNVLLVKHEEIPYFSLLLFCQPLKINELKSKGHMKKIMVLVTLFTVTVDCSLHFNFIC